MSTKCLFWALKQAVGNPYQKLILVSLADIANEKRECWPSHQYLMERAECSRSSVIRHLKELEKKGLIAVRRRTDENGMKASNIYRLPDVSERHNDVSQRHKGSVTETQGGSVTETHNTPTLLDTPNDTPIPVPLFEVFYSAYPRKAKRGDAERAFKKLKATPEIVESLLADIAARIAQGAWDANGPDKQYIPYPASYLNGKGWEDDIIPRAGFSPAPDFSAIAQQAEEFHL